MFRWERANGFPGAHPLLEEFYLVGFTPISNAVFLENLCA